MKLVTMMAKACHYAQEHVDDSEAWPTSEYARDKYFTAVSHQMSCFLAQNTRNGMSGVESGIVLDELIARPMKSERKWTEILNKHAKLMGGWKTNIEE